MLSLEESGLLFRFLSFYSSAYIFPFEVDRTQGKLRKFSGRKFNLWLCVYSLALILYVQGLSRFLSLLTFSPDQVVLLHLPAQFDALIAPLPFHLAIIMIYCFNRELLVTVFNELFNSCSTEEASKAHRPFREMSIQELLIFWVHSWLVGLQYSTDWWFFFWMTWHIFS